MAYLMWMYFPWPCLLGQLNSLLSGDTCLFILFFTNRDPSHKFSMSLSCFFSIPLYLLTSDWLFSPLPYLLLGLVQVAKWDVKNIVIWTWNTWCLFWWHFKWSLSNSSMSWQICHILYSWNWELTNEQWHFSYLQVSIVTWSRTNF